MNFFTNISYNNWVDIFICLFSLLGGYFTSKLINKKPIKREILQNQLNFVYSPLFQKLEPNLYKKLDEETVRDYLLLFKNIKSTYYDFIDSKTLLEINKFEDNYINKNHISFINFSRLCYNVDKQFEKIRKKLGLPTRSFAYKWENKQYPKNVQLKIERLCKIIVILIVSIIIALLIFCIIYLISFYLSSLIVKLTN